MGQLSFWFAPNYLLFPIALILKTPPFWLFMIGNVFCVVFLVLAVYYCVKQKCYKQLTVWGLAVIFWMLAWNAYCYLECVIKPGMQIT